MISVLPKWNPAVEAHLPGRQKAGLNEARLRRHLIIQTKPGAASGSAKGVALGRIAAEICLFILVCKETPLPDGGTPSG